MFEPFVESLLAVDLPTATAIVLLIIAVISGLVPGIPGGLIASVVIVSHWYVVGVLDPLFVAILAGFALLTGILDILAGVVAGEKGGASRVATSIGVICGFIGLISTGIFGLFLGMVGGIFVVELVRQRSTDKAFRSALYSMIGILASNIFQATILGFITVGWVVLVVF